VKKSSWWNVTPSGGYSADLETGKEHARAFLTMMVFNAGHRDRSGARKNEVPALDRDGYRSTKVSSKAKSRR
jgi:hypothetical protein